MPNLNFSNSNILVTGGTGFIGSHLVEELVKLKARVIATRHTIDSDAYYFTRKLDKKAITIRCNVCQFNKVYQLVTKYHIDYIFHLAAQPLVEVAYQTPSQTLYTNILGTINVLESARITPKVKAVVVASSDKAYGKLEKDKYLETDPLRGDHPYEVSKSAADLIAASYFKTYNLPVVVTRFGNIYGEGDLHYSRILPGILKATVKGETLKIRSNGQYVRDYLYVKDVIRGYLLLCRNIEKVKGEAFNFGSDETLSVIELINLIEESLNKKLKYKILNIAKNEIPYQSLDFSKINQLLKWKPEYKLKDILPKVYSWYKKALT